MLSSAPLPCLLVLSIKRSKRRKDGEKNYYIGCADKKTKCPARLVVRQKVKIDEEGLMEEFFEITDCNMTHHCERLMPDSRDHTPASPSLSFCIDLEQLYEFRKKCVQAILSMNLK